MKKLIAFFEIPATDFRRAVRFYETIFNTQLPVYEGKEEKMAFFMEEEECAGAISFAPNFRPSEKGVLLSFNCEDIEAMHSMILRKEGRIIIPKTKIQAENKGYFSVFADSEGNHIGLYADQ